MRKTIGWLIHESRGSLEYYGQGIKAFLRSIYTPQEYRPWFILTWIALTMSKIACWVGRVDQIVSLNVIHHPGIHKPSKYPLEVW